MPPPSKGKAKTNAEGSKGGGLAAAGGEQSEDHSFAEVVSQHSKNLEELRERQKVGLSHGVGCRCCQSGATPSEDFRGLMAPTIG